MAPPIREILQKSEARLSGVDSPRLSAELLLAHVVGCSRLSLVVDRDRQLTDEELAQFEAFVERRAHGEPLAYILGKKEFYALDFRVTPDVLIPRPETEHIIEEVESLFEKEHSFRFADLGTGSGILAVTIAVLFAKAHGVAVDLSDKALDVAADNAGRHGVDDRVEFLHADFLTSVLPDGKFDLIVSNPPYVTEAEYAAASHEVVDFEPETALVSGADGLDHVRGMLKHVLYALKPGGVFLLEMGCDQGKGVQSILAEDFSEFDDVRVIQDLAGLDRIVFARKL